MKKSIKGMLLAILAVSMFFVACDKEVFTPELDNPNSDLELRANNNNFIAQLSGANEVPPNESGAVGTTIVRIAKDETSINFRLIAANIDSVFAAHFHMAPAGVNGPVVVTLYGGPLVPQQNGVLAEGTIEADDVTGEIAGDLAALIEAIRAGNIYVNVHTNAVPGGEIRGQVE